MASNHTSRYAFPRPLKLERLEDRVTPTANLQPISLRGELARRGMDASDWRVHLPPVPDFSDPTDFDGQTYQGSGTEFIDVGDLKPNVTYSFYVTVDADPTQSDVQTAHILPPAGPTSALTGGIVENAGTSNEVVDRMAIQVWNSSQQAINPQATTWLIIHGRNSSPADLSDLSSAVATARPQDQVLTLDWSDAAASGLLGGRGENFIQPAAQWASIALSLDGIGAAQLNLIGHSWGGDVAGELAARYDLAAPPAATVAWSPALLGPVNTIVGLDPAIDYPGGYDPEVSVNLSAHAKFSWGFHDASGTGQLILFGSPITAATAAESFVVLGSSHGGLIDMFTQFVSGADNPIFANSLTDRFSLDRLLAGDPNPIWKPNSFRADGTAGGPGTNYEAVISTDHDRIYALTYDQLPNGATPVVRDIAYGDVVSDLRIVPPGANQVAVTVDDAVTNFGRTLSARWDRRVLRLARSRPVRRRVQPRLPAHSRADSLRPLGQHRHTFSDRPAGRGVHVRRPVFGRRDQSDRHAQR